MYEPQTKAQRIATLNRIARVRSASASPRRFLRSEPRFTRRQLENVRRLSGMKDARKAQEWFREMVRLGRMGA